MNVEEQTRFYPAIAMPTTTQISHDQRIEHFEEQARRAYLHARARGVKLPSLSPEFYAASSHLRYWQSVKWRRESGFTVEGER